MDAYAADVYVEWFDFVGFEPVTEGAARFSVFIHADVTEGALTVRALVEGHLKRCFFDLVFVDAKALESVASFAVRPHMNLLRRLPMLCDAMTSPTLTCHHKLLGTNAVKKGGGKPLRSCQIP